MNKRKKKNFLCLISKGCSSINLFIWPQIILKPWYNIVTKIKSQAKANFFRTKFFFRNLEKWFKISIWFSKKRKKRCFWELLRWWQSIRNNCKLRFKRLKMDSKLFARKIWSKCSRIWSFNKNTSSLLSNSYPFAQQTYSTWISSVFFRGFTLKMRQEFRTDRSMRNKCNLQASRLQKTSSRKIQES